MLLLAPKSGSTSHRFLIFLTIVATPLSVEYWNYQLSININNAVENYWKPPVVVVLGTFTHRNEALPSPFLRWLTNDLRAIIPQTKSLRLLTQASAAMATASRQAFAGLFDKGNVDAILYRQFSDGTLGAPYMTAFIKVVASTKPFTNTEIDFADIQGTARGSISRGSAPASGEGARAEGPHR